MFDEDEVFVDDVLVRPTPPTQYWLLHKPHGVFSTASDPHGRPDLKPWLEGLPQGVFPVGRLDRATTGALLLCDDGDLSHMLLTPEHHIDKTYVLTCRGVFDHHDPRVLSLTQGVELRDGPARAKRTRVFEHPQDARQTCIELVLDEGRNRQIRRMCKVTRLDLIHLHRTHIASLELSPLPGGQLRQLTPEQVKSLWDSVGGPLVVRTQTLNALHTRARTGEFPDTCLPRVREWLDAHDPRV